MLIYRDAGFSIRGDEVACGTVEYLGWHEFGEQEEDCAGNHPGLGRDRDSSRRSHGRYL